MKILLFGRNGQLGWELQRSLAPLGDLVALDARGDASGPADFEEPESLAAWVRRVAPDVIVNAAAYTAVDRAEKETDRAMRVNADAPGALARAAATAGAWLVHYSTDYVFDGSGSGPWREDAPTGPLNAYGRSKLAGEALIRGSGCRHLILRTSWVYSARGDNFARTMLRLGRERESLSVIDDQVGAPTGADLLADITAHALRTVAARPELAGTYHATAAGETSWHGYARHVVEVARRLGQPVRATPERIQAISSSAYPQAATRPKNSRLATAKLRAAFALSLPPWQHGVERMLAEVAVRQEPA
jgi:dTDP-4-dehydrorhamnose reductase